MYGGVLLVDDSDGLIEGVSMHDAESRSEDLFLVASHVGGNLVNDGRSNEVSLRILSVLVASSIEDEFSSFLHSGVKERENTCAELRVAERSDINAFFETSSELELHDLLLELRDPFLSLTDQDNSGERHASLASRAESSGDKRVECVFLIAVRHDNTVVLSAHVALNSFAVLGAVFVDELACSVAADEGDCLDVFVFSDLLDSLEASVNEVDDTFRDAELVEHVDEVH